MSTTAKKYSGLIIGIIVIAVIGVAVGVIIGHRNASNKLPSDGVVQPAKVSTMAPDALVSYTVPTGLSLTNCAGETVYLVPTGTNTDCQSSVPQPIGISVDANNTTNCNQLQPTNNQGIRDHTCKSLYIDGHKSLQALTEYSTVSSYKVDTTFADYYVSTSKGVVKFEYIYTSSSSLTDEFNQLALSTKVKS